MAVLNLDTAIATVKAHRDHLARTNAQCQAWDAAGIRSMLATADGTPTDILAAALLTAGDASCRLPSPAALRNHWPVNAAATAPAPRNRDMCPEHPDTVRVDCHRHEPPASPEQIAVIRAQIRDDLQARGIAVTRHDRRPGLDWQPADLTEARERMDTTQTEGADA